MQVFLVRTIHQLLARLDLNLINTLPEILVAKKVNPTKPIQQILQITFKKTLTLLSLNLSQLNHNKGEDYNRQDFKR